MRRRTWQGKAALVAILAILAQALVPLLPARAGEKTILCDPVRGAVAVYIDLATGEPVEAPAHEPTDCRDHCVLCSCVMAGTAVDTWQTVAVAAPRLRAPAPTPQVPATWREHARQPRGPPSAPLA